MITDITKRIRLSLDSILRSNSQSACGDPRRLKSWSTGVAPETVDAETQVTRGIIAKCTNANSDGETSDPFSTAIDIAKGFQAVLPFNVDGYGGTITPGDCVFIASMIESIRPQRVIEIGVAFGYSSAFTLYCMQRNGLLKAGDVALHSFDIEEGKPWWSEAGTRWSERTIGELVGVAVPELSDFWALHTRSTSAEMATADTGSHANCFPAMGMIDAAHWHPWPLIDLLALCHVLPSGSWIMMQDVSLSTRLLTGCIEWGGNALFSHYGAQIVFEHWPFEKFRGVGGCYNMAAVRIPEDKALIGEAMRPLLSYPYESEIGPKETAFLDKFLG
jgi:cephalosporin hydroxylase